MASAEIARQAAARLWPEEPCHHVLWHGESVRFAVPGLTARGRDLRSRGGTGVLRRLLLGFLWRLVKPGWLFVVDRPTLVRADHPDADAVRLARALAPVRVEGLREEGVLRLPWLIITPNRVGAFVTVAGEATPRWTGTPTAMAPVRRGRGWYLRLVFLDGSSARLAIPAADAAALDCLDQ